MGSEIIYLFIEEKKDRYDSLCEVLEQRFPNLPNNILIEKVNSSYADAFSELLSDLDNRNKKIAPTFAFIDPFGIKGLPLKIMVQLMAHERTEILVTIMTGFIHRFISTPEFERHCDDLFGCGEWRDARQLVGYEKESFLKKLYEKQLMHGVGAKYVRFFTMKNEDNRTIYDLFFATNSETGIDKMKDAMWRVNTSGEYVFTDATDPMQELLFTSEPDWEKLIEHLCNQFSGKTVPWTEVEEEIRRTPFRIMKTPIKHAAKEDNPRLIINNPKRSNTLNEHASVTFY